MIDQAERAASEELLAVYRRTLAHLLQQQEQYRSTGYVPLMVVNDIYNAREQIRQIKDRLRSQGAIVEDQSDDGASGDQNIPCPYPGVRAFTTSDSPYFFGREKEIKNLLLRLRLQRFLFVIGPSGSGKSSLVRAGLIVELDRTQAGLYQVLEMRPGATPLRALEQALGASFAQRQSYDAAVKALLAAAPPTQRILLIVDQFEEIFTQASAGDQEAFIAAIKALSQLDFCAVIVVMRADFYADLMVSSAWPLTLGQRIEVVPLAGAALRLAIEQPAIAVGVRIQPALLERLLADAAREPGVLPLVQETMRLLWEQMEDRGLTLQAYERLGGAEQSGLSAALGLMADAALEQLDNGRQKIARRILLRLVQFGEGRANTRRQQPIAKLRAADDDQTQFDATLQHLTTSRLLTLSGDALNDTRRIDIAHEALLHWSTFRIWIAERGAAEQTRRQLEAKVEEWVRMGSGDGGLLDAVELREAVGWLALPDSAELGHSKALLALITRSQRAIKPGWERRGLAILIVGGLALAALVGLLAIAAAAWPLILQRALILITSVALVITIVLALLFHRADSAFGQRLSHGIAGRRWPIRVVGTIALLAMAAWASFGWDMSAREAHCTAPPRGYRHAKLYYPNIAVDASAMLNGEANVISFFLSQLTFAPVVSDQDWSDCQSFFEYRLRLSPIDRPGEHGYAATLYPNQSTASAEPVLLATGSQLRCGFLADLAVQIADHLQIPNSSDVEQWRSLAAPASCAVILKAQQGLEAIKAERYDDAERILLEVIEASERRWSVVYRYLGAVYLRTGRKQAATAALERAVALLPRPFTKAHTPFLITLAQAYYQQNKRPQAEQTLLTALTADPLHGYAHLNLAVYYREWGDYTRAAEHLQAARAWTPKGPGDQVAFVRSLDAAGGVLAFKLGRFDDAIELLEKAYRRHESLSELPYEHQGNGEAIVYYLAASYGETGQAARACSYWAIYDSIPLSNRTEELSRRQEAQQRRAGLACA